jgi:hypothetical protein
MGGLTMRIHSNSSLGSFEKCPRKYWYQYIGKPPVEKVDTIEVSPGRPCNRFEKLCRLGLSEKLEDAVRYTGRRQPST